ncbi:MAG: hypothetical protein CSA09_01385 [Candidatus Contendobacter odensis]|uniref:Haloacid dehalogenase n=1 Tax=Candidatus Contendibacter odensensis TaxID=1400860 RepID=A0A2G6PG32_9GAMM|nr:MAG: hypothetical protein CSA09_01385 [Candidatus Contendobacter odensis]
MNNPAETIPKLIVPDGIQGLIFDCDGTLADTLPLHYAAWQEAFAAVNQQCPVEFLLEHNGKPTDLIVDLYNKKFGTTIDTQQLTIDKERRTYAQLHRAQPIEAVIVLVRRYHGRLPMAVVSGSNRDNVERTLHAIGVFDLFTTILTADDGLPPKPAPDLFLEAAQRLGVKPQYCQVFEDADAGLEAARCAGMLPTDVRPAISDLARQVKGSAYS